VPFLSPIALLVAALIVGNIGFLAAWRVTANAYESFRTEVSLRAKVQEEHVKSVVKEQERVTDETVKGWSAAMDVVRADYAKRLRNAGSGQMPGISKPPRSIDAIPADALPIAAECAETTLTLVTLQGWVRNQEKASR
jgi:hypothetical protein